MAGLFDMIDSSRDLLLLLPTHAHRQALFRQRNEAREDAHLCPERAQDELASARGAHGGEEVGVLPRVESGSVDRRAFLEAVGLLRPDETLTVECPVGSPKVFASFTVDTLFLSTTSDPWTGPR